MNLPRRNVWLAAVSTLLLSACASIMPTAGSDKPPVVFVHGNGDTAA